MLKLKPIDRTKVQKLVAAATAGISASPLLGVAATGALMTMLPLVRPASATFKKDSGSSGASSSGNGGSTPVSSAKAAAVAAGSNLKPAVTVPTVKPAASAAVSAAGTSGAKAKAELPAVTAKPDPVKAASTSSAAATAAVSTGSKAAAAPPTPPTPPTPSAAASTTVMDKKASGNNLNAVAPGPTADSAVSGEDAEVFISYRYGLWRSYMC